jgi:hypothetical protein
MNEKMSSMLEALANKLGVAANHLWEILVKQEIIDSWLCFGVFVLILISTGFVVKHFLGWFKDDNSEVPVDAKKLLFILVLFVIGLILIAPVSQMRFLFNPEVGAFKGVLNALTHK